MSAQPKEQENAARRPPCETPVKEFVAVAQCDFPQQMDVVRWLLQDDSYTCFYIVHNADFYSEEDIATKGENGVITRKNGDSSESQFKVGDRKPEHIHIFVQTKTKMRSSTLKKRFCEQLHFMSAQKEYGDKYEAARYLTHESFRARSKHKYSRSDIKYSEGGACDAAITLYSELMQTEDGALIDDLKTFIDIKKATPDNAKAVHAVIASGDARLIRRIMSHAYFFDKLL